MREVISHMIMVHELPFNFVEYGLFNVVMKEANPGFNKISRASVKQDCISSYEIGKKRVQILLDSVKRVSITTDMWTSNQNIHYMVVTCHFVDSDFKLHKRILSFVDVPPPYSGVFHDGLGEIDDIIHNVRESVKHVNASPGRLHIFSELTKQLSMPKKHLILDVSTRWNATYAMLSTALEFKEVFVNYVDRESTYTTLLSEEDWKKVEEVCSFLALFNEATKSFQEGVLIGESGVYFDALGWWKENNLKFNILSKMAADILAIPVTTVASESAFSAGGRVIDPHRSSLGTKMVDMLVCGADWYRQYYELEKNKNKQNEDIMHVELP
ncbi:zinc finger BED domain-containing protein RICESLEEPER 2-like [Hibiscus syriacus]|uniref:zinc finger BED domain-containing protein RICESLEEPER 2-like n=1 Tax=Hibiscus syriacus TaxID=106335 RepID=UPI0019242090|nr:zinc finger BED domain-containing protein RICESLEEPER 2-like [Hibiscus syriacus]